MSGRALSGALALALCGAIAPAACASESPKSGGEGKHGGLLSIGISIGSGKPESQAPSGSSSEEKPKGISVSVSTPLLSGTPEVTASAGPVKATVSGSTPAPAGKSSGSSTSETKSPASEGTSTTTVGVGSVAKVSVANQSESKSQPGAATSAQGASSTGTGKVSSAGNGLGAAGGQGANPGPSPAGNGSPSGGAAARRALAAEHRASSTSSRTHATTASHNPAPASTRPLATGGSPLPRTPRRPSARHHSRSGSDPLSTIGGHLPSLGLPVPDWSRPIILILLLLTLALGARAYITARRARRLQRTQSALEGDMQLMQTALVPEVPAQLGTLAISTAYRPADGPAAGGDFYDVFPLPDGRVAMILGDVSGHGHEALHQAALTRYTLRAYMEAGLEPGAALALAGEVMSDPQFEHFATVIAGIYDERSSLLTYSSAGHPHPLTIGVAGPEALGGYSSPALGWGVPTGQRQTVLALCPATAVCFFSDGLVEARTEAGLLGRDGLRELLEGLDQPNAAELLAAVQRISTAVSDDMAACVISQRAPLLALAPGRWEELQIDAQLLAGDGPRRFMAACGVSDTEQARTLTGIRELLHGAGGVRLRLRVDRAERPELRATSANRGGLDGNQLGALSAVGRM